MPKAQCAQELWDDLPQKMFSFWHCPKRGWWGEGGGMPLPFPEFGGRGRGTQVWYLGRLLSDFYHWFWFFLSSKLCFTCLGFLYFCAIVLLLDASRVAGDASDFCQHCGTDLKLDLSLCPTSPQPAVQPVCIKCPGNASARHISLISLSIKAHILFCFSF